VEHGIKDRPRDRGAVSWVRKPIGTGKLHAATGRTDDEHVADVAARRCGQLEIGKQLQTAGSDHITTGLVTREGRFVDHGDLCAAPSQQYGGDAAGGSASDDECVKSRQAHAAPFAISDLQ
jgi:hypothetical protein